MLQIQQLRKFYGDFLALRDVTFSVAPGDVVGLLGPNGAGKSTTMRSAVGFIPYSAGSIQVDGLEVARFPVETRRRIGYLPEHTPLYGDMRVREFLTYRARIKGVPRRELAARVDYVMERTWLRDRARQFIDTLSKGYRQRVGLADALVGNPRLLILDEPTIGLDPNQVQGVRQLIRELGESHTIVLSTHILQEVEVVCNRVVIIARGRTVADDTVSGLLEAHRQRAFRVGLRADATTDAVRVKLAAARGVTAVEPLWEAFDGPLQRFDVAYGEDLPEAAVGEAISNAVAAAGWGLIELAPRRATLESIFVQLTLRDEEVAA